jgi:hypothetical protein
MPLVAPDTLFEDRRNQLDLRLSKIIRIARTQLQANVDFYNALNSNAILALNSTYGAQWLQPSRILDPRMIQLSGTLSF